MNWQLKSDPVGLPAALVNENNRLHHDDRSKSNEIS